MVVATSVNAGYYLAFPPSGFSLRWYAAFFNSPSFMTALVLSLEVAGVAAFFAALIGTPAAMAYVRSRGPFREPFRLLLLSPLVLPEILTAIALLFFFNLFFSGLRSLVPLVIGHTVLIVPFVFLTVTSALYNMPAQVDEAARTLGATPGRVFFRVTLPLIKSGIIAGTMLAFIISFDNVTMSLLLKAIGTSTLPIQLFDYLRLDFDPTAAAAASISVVFTLGIVVIIDRMFGLRALRF
ncbi:ABC transporter permease [Acuticoccus mangrovi]|uniref:ABC transporter permease n=1 Tax=Acuticoccus mangrovi TaxID=2796142 RepID=UPI002FC6ADEE